MKKDFSPSKYRKQKPTKAGPSRFAKIFISRTSEPIFTTFSHGDLVRTAKILLNIVPSSQDSSIRQEEAFRWDPCRFHSILFYSVTPTLANRKGVSYYGIPPERNVESRRNLFVEYGYLMIQHQQLFSWYRAIWTPRKQSTFINA